MVPLPFRRALAVLMLATAPAASAPTAATQPARPAVRSAAFSEAIARAETLPRLRSLLVSVDGSLEVEHYVHGGRRGGLANIKSASKSVISALVGIAIAQGAIAGVDEPIGGYFPALLAGEDDAGRRAITIEDLLTMRSGLETTSNRNYGRWVTSGNWVRFALRQPMTDLPGTRMEYSTGSSHLLSAILTKATGQSTWAFAADTLAKPLGFSLAPWPRDPQGVYFGGNDMLMTPRQMLAFGELYLSRGRAGNTQVLPGSWVDRSFTPRARSRFGRDRLYGYGWWIRELAGHATYYAWGYGGQFIFVVPDLRLVAVTTSASDVGYERLDHLDGIYDLVAEAIIPVVEARDASAP
ncbi:MAG: serine hydrolase domain-containing protein [Vicinamibacterales bacterium]